MSRRILRSGRLTRDTAVRMAVSVLLAGCAPSGGPGMSELRERVHIPDAAAVPRVVVLGGLGSILPKWNDTPALERFLYGPDPDQSATSGLRNPQGLAMLDGRLLVCDQGLPDVLVVDLQTGRSRGWSDVEKPPRCPVGIAVGADGRAYVADTTLRSVLVYGPNGRFIEELRPGERGRDATRPCGIAVHGGVVYVGDLISRSVERYDLARRSWRPAIGLPPESGGPLVSPTGIGVTPDGIVLVVDAVRGVVDRLAPDGGWLSPIGRPGRGPGQLVRPKQVCCTPSGLIFISDAGRQSVLVFRDDGRHLFEIDASRGGWSGFSLPMGLTAIVGRGHAASGPAVSGRSATVEPSVFGGEYEEYVIVSDTLGGEPLVVMGVVRDKAEVGTGGR